MKITLAITAAIASAVTTAAHASHPIQVNMAKVSPEAKAAAKQYIDQYDSKLSDEIFNAMISSVDQEFDEIPLDVRSLLASTNDSSGIRLRSNRTGTVYQCYSNCYTNCHGSRGWR